MCRPLKAGLPATSRLTGQRRAEGRHYFAESEDVAVFFLPMDAIDSAAKDPFRSGRWEMTAIYEVSLGIPSSSFDSSN